MSLPDRSRASVGSCFELVSIIMPISGRAVVTCVVARVGANTDTNEYAMLVVAAGAGGKQHHGRRRGAPHRPQPPVRHWDHPAPAREDQRSRAGPRRE